MVIKRGSKGSREWSPRRKFILVGDILHPGKIVVEATSLEQALQKAEAGDFEVYDESGKNLAFQWNGDPETVEVEE